MAEKKSHEQYKFKAETAIEDRQMHARCMTADSHAGRVQHLRQQWVQGTANTLRNQMEISTLQQLKDRRDDLKYGQQLVKNLGFAKLGAKSATKEP